ncbi:MAG: OmpA family protein, partial [Bacteroidota bacterium]
KLRLAQLVVGFDKLLNNCHDRLPTSIESIQFSNEALMVIDSLKKSYDASQAQINPKGLLPLKQNEVINKEDHFNRIKTRFNYRLSNKDSLLSLSSPVFHKATFEEHVSMMIKERWAKQGPKIINDLSNEAYESILEELRIQPEFAPYLYLASSVQVSNEVLKKLFSFEKLYPKNFVNPGNELSSLSSLVDQTFDKNAEQVIRPLTIQLIRYELLKKIYTQIDLQLQKELTDLINQQINLERKILSAVKSDLNINQTAVVVSWKEYLSKPIKNYSIQEGQAIPLNGVFFQPNSNQLIDFSNFEVNRVKELIQQNPVYTYELGVFLSGKISHQMATELSRQRAKSIVERLIDIGIPKEKLRFRGYGKNAPFVAPDEYISGTFITIKDK